jgi:hypothetical protein
MSILPCDRHGDIAKGALRGVYPTLIYAGVRYARKLRLCDDCLDEFLDTHDTEWRQQTFRGRDNVASTCARCSSEPPAGKLLNPFYLTIFPRKDHRVDYYAQYCPSCSEALKVGLELTPEAPRAA